MFSCTACGHIFELCTITITFLLTAFTFFLIDWKKEGESSAIWLIAVLSVVAVVMVVLTIRKVYGRWRKVSTEVFTSEV